MGRLFALILCFFISTVFSFAQYCLNGGPSSVDDSNVESVNISGEFGTSISYAGCPGTIGVEDATNLAVTLDAGSNYTLEVQFGTCGGNYAGVGEAWIDFNSNAIFDANESIGTWSGTPPVAISTFNFTVPVNSQNASVIMRVVQHESGSIPIDPCGSFTWGSVVDFSVNIQSGVDCSGYEGNYPETAIEITSMPFTDTKSTSYCYFSSSTVYSSPDIFYKYVVTDNSSKITASLCGSNFDTYLTVQDTGFTALFYNDDSDSCAPSSEVSFYTDGLDTIYFVVEGYGQDTGTYTINITEEILNSNYEKEIPEIKIYPNPVKDVIRVEGVEKGKLNIFTMDLKLVKTVYSKFQKIDVSDLNKGVYILSYESEIGIEHQKIIIE